MKSLLYCFEPNFLHLQKLKSKDSYRMWKAFREGMGGDEPWHILEIPGYLVLIFIQISCYQHIIHIITSLAYSSLDPHCDLLNAPPTPWSQLQRLALNPPPRFVSSHQPRQSCLTAPP